MRGGYKSAFYGMLPLRGGAEPSGKRQRTQPTRFSFAVKTFASPTAYLLLITDSHTGVTYHWTFDDPDDPTLKLMVMESREADQPLLIVHVRYEPESAVVQVREMQPDECSAQTCEKLYLTSSYEMYQPQKYTLMQSHVDHVLNEANTRLRAVCPTLSIQLRNLLEQSGTITAYSPTNNYLTACIYNAGDCVASIQFIVQGDTVAILSKTRSDLEGRGLNQVLRAVVMLLAPHIQVNGKQVRFIESQAQNWKSAYLLLSRYDCVVDDAFRKYLAKLQRQGADVSITPELVQAYYRASEDDYGYIEVEIPLTPANLAKAQGELEKMRVKCSDM